MRAVHIYLDFCFVHFLQFFSLLLFFSFSFSFSVFLLLFFFCFHHFSSCARHTCRLCTTSCRWHVTANHQNHLALNRWLQKNNIYESNMDNYLSMSRDGEIYSLYLSLSLSLSFLLNISFFQINWQENNKKFFCFVEIHCFFFIFFFVHVKEIIAIDKYHTFTSSDSILSQFFLLQRK